MHSVLLVAFSLFATVGATLSAQGTKPPIPVRVVVSSSVVGPSRVDTSLIRQAAVAGLTTDSAIMVLPPLVIPSGSRRRIDAATALRMGHIPGARFAVSIDVSGSANRFSVRIRGIDIESTQFFVDSVIGISRSALIDSITTLARRNTNQLVRRELSSTPR
jgi:hypothetical protein